MEKLQSDVALGVEKEMGKELGKWCNPTQLRFLTWHLSYYESSSCCNKWNNSKSCEKKASISSLWTAQFPLLDREEWILQCMGKPGRVRRSRREARKGLSACRATLWLLLLTHRRVECSFHSGFHELQSPPPPPPCSTQNSYFVQMAFPSVLVSCGCYK